jgi:hypothetical protein
MRVRLFVSATKALKAGKDEHGHRIVEVPAASLTQEQREELANYCSSSDSYDFDLAVNTVSLRFPLAEASPENAVWIINELIDRRHMEEQKKAAEHEKAVQAWLDLPVDQWVGESHQDFHVYEWRSNMPSRPNDPRLEDKLTVARALAANLTEEKKAKEKAAREERESRAVEEQAQKNANQLMFRQWAKIYGSDLLKARIEEKFAWEELAEQEYADQLVISLEIKLKYCPETPEGYLSNEARERTTPTLEEIQQLKDIRAKAEGKPIAVALNWATYAPDEDGDEIEPLGRPEIMVTVTCPNGAKKQYWFLPGGVAQPAVS